MLQEVRSVVASTLQLGARANDLSASSPLLGAIPELDSMAVIALLTALEDRFGIAIDDDDVSAENLKTLGALVQFVEGKLSR
jgi:acyl carrier protein